MKYAGIIQNQGGTYRAFLFNAVSIDNAQDKLDRIVWALKTQWRQTWIVPVDQWDGLVERDPIARHHLRFLPDNWQDLPVVTHTKQMGMTGQTFVYSAQGEQIGAETWRSAA